LLPEVLVFELKAGLFRGGLVFGRKIGVKIGKNCKKLIGFERFLAEIDKNYTVLSTFCTPIFGKDYKLGL